MKRPDLFIERIQLRETSPESDWEREAADRLGSDNRAILERYDARAMREAVEAKLALRAAETAANGADPQASGPRKTLRFPSVAKSSLYRAVPIAAAACLVIAGAVTYLAAPQLFSGGLGASAPILGDGFAVRVKGGPALHVYRKTGDGAESLSSGATAGENDMLQISYSAGGDAWGAILSVDGNGTVTQHFPDGGDTGAKLESGGEVALPFSYRLDDAPKFERFIFVSGPREFSLADLKHDLSNLARIHRTGSFALMPLLPDGTKAIDILLRK